MKISPALQAKMDYYLQGNPFSGVKLPSATALHAQEFLQKKSLAKIAHVTEGVREDIRKALIMAQTTNQPVVGAASMILGQAKLEKGVFRSSRARATFIAQNELRAARQEGLLTSATARGQVMFTWICVMSKGSCEVCIARHGQTHSGSTWRGIGIPPSPHPRCACGLIPGRMATIPKAMTRTAVRDLGVQGRVFRQVGEKDYVSMKQSFIECTNQSMGLK